ncbi:MAG TPA: NAD(P)-dependent oxidoreductase [Candidatus Angelobacter sp.]|jgi:3-hydroxyisobutyrate dehydrogenase-like beta-hydroxyacid dehydrogenase|nr:NAD(P)-dependent oxidoreductase [Candidatus Angelobacter sp.]
MNIAFIGLGNMGSAMATNLLKAGHTLTVYNRSRARADVLKSLGARVASTPGEAAGGAEVAITMLADDHAVEAVVFGRTESGAGNNEKGTAGRANLLDSLPSNSVHVSMSTISVALSRRLAAAHAERKQHYVAAPVFGRPEAAAAAKLFIVAAGPAAQIERCNPLFNAMGQKTFVAGDDASGANLMKLTGNFLITAVIEGLAESFALVRKAGLDANLFHEILTNSLFNAPIYKTYGALINSQKFEPAGFKLPLGMKDNRLLLAAAEEAAVPMPMASLIRDRFLAAVAQGMSESDWSAISRISAKEAGL